MGKEYVFQLHRRSQPLPQKVFGKEVAELNPRLGVLIGVERGNAAFGGTKGFAAQTLFLVGVLKNVVRHKQLGPVRDHQLG